MLKYKQELLDLLQILVDVKILREFKVNEEKQRIDSLDIYGYPLTLSIKNDYLVNSCIEYLWDKFNNVFIELQ